MIPIRCLKKPGQRYNGLIAGQRIEFAGGESRTVARAIAEVLLAKRDNLDKALFEQVNFDTTDIQDALGIQCEWKQWPST